LGVVVGRLTKAEARSPGGGMPGRKPNEEVDWYVDLSEQLERREERRRWIILGLFVGGALVLIGGFTLVAVLHSTGYLGRFKEAIVNVVRNDEPRPPQLAPAPLSVPKLHEGDIQFSQLDSEGMVTSITHFFREMLPKNATAFTINRDTENHGTAIVYCLRNLATGEIQSFADVEVKRVGSEWVITEDAWRRIRDALQVRMKVRLSRPIFGGISAIRPRP